MYFPKVLSIKRLERAWVSEPPSTYAAHWVKHIQQEEFTEKII